MNNSNRRFLRGAVLLLLLLFCGPNYATAGAPPLVSNVRASQRPDAQSADIYDNLVHPDCSLPAPSSGGIQEATVRQFGC